MYDKKRVAKRPVILAATTSTNFSVARIPGNFNSNDSESAYPLAL